MGESGRSDIIERMERLNIGICEDDSHLRSVLERSLRREGFGVRLTSSGREAVDVFSASPPDLLVLDIGLPDADGRDVCQALRVNSVTSPVIFLTARDALTDRLSGFHVGADDYVTKPFAVAELIARIRVAGRRRAGATEGAPGGLEVDPVTHAVRRDERSAPLTPTEFRMLASLAARPGEVVRRDELRAAAWPDGAIVHDNTSVHPAAAAQARRRRERGEPRDRARRRLRAAMSRLTLRARVTLAAMGVFAVGLLAFSGLFNILLASRLNADASAVLRTRAAAQLATLDISHGGLRTVEGPRDAALDRDAWVIAGGRVIERPAVESPAVARAVSSLAGVTHVTEKTVPGSIRLRAAPVRGPAGDRRGTVVVGVSLVPYEHTRRIALVGTAILSLVLLIGAAIAVRWAVRSALRPIAEMTARAADWSERDLHQRFGLGPPRDELTTLAATFDGLLRRIEAVLRHEQRFSAELAHELRTPLTGLRGEAELALLRPELDSESRSAFERVLESSRRMETVIETLLATARMEEEAGSMQSCDPLPAVRDAMGAVANAARSRDVQVELAEPRSSLVVDADPAVVTR